MKDATGELSMTAVAVVAIAAISVVFSTLIWPTIKANIMRSTYCSQAFNCQPTNSDGMYECNYCTEGTRGENGELLNQDCNQTVQCAANDITGAGA